MHIDPNQYFYELLTSLNNLSSVDSKIVLSELYEIKYGIFRHDVIKNRPLASVAFHDAEEVIRDSLLENRMKQYNDKSIYDVFKISFLEFMELPTHIIEMLYHVANQINSSKQKQLSAIEDQFHNK